MGDEELERASEYTTKVAEPQTGGEESGVLGTSVKRGDAGQQVVVQACNEYAVVRQ